MEYSQQLINHKIKQALALWAVYIAVTLLINATLPFLFGVNVREWTYPPAKDVLVNIFIYWGIFLFAPLVLVKGWEVVRKPAFLGPLLLAGLALGFRTYVRPVSAIAILILIGVTQLKWNGPGKQDAVRVQPALHPVFRCSLHRTA